MSQARLTRFAAAATVCGILALLCGGCAAETAAQPLVAKPDTLTETDRSRITQHELDTLWNETGLPANQRPADIPMVRYVTLDEWASVIAQCMTDEGAPATEEGGGISYRSTVETAGTFKLAQYTCQSRYPTDPVMLTPLNESQLRFLYAYYTGSLRECLREHDADITDPPSEDVFIESYGRTPWDPMTDITDPTLLERDGPCPQVPVGLFG